MGKDTLYRATFSPHSPFGSLVATGGESARLGIVDMRNLGSNSMIWHIDDAHNGPITDVEFSPFVPYWLASSGKDGVVKIWDIRFIAGHVGRIDGNYDSVEKVISYFNIDCVVEYSCRYNFNRFVGLLVECLGS